MLSRLRFILCLSLLMLMTGCASWQWNKKLIRVTPDTDSFQCDAQLRMPVKNATYSLDAVVSVKIGECVRISMRMPVLNTEVARVDITPTTILFVDRQQKRYNLSQITKVNSFIESKNHSDEAVK